MEMVVLHILIWGIGQMCLRWQPMTMYKGPQLNNMKPDKPNDKLIPRILMAVSV